jgi:hypothetical protein
MFTELSALVVDMCREVRRLLKSGGGGQAWGRLVVKLKLLMESKC